MVDVISCRYRMEGLWFIALSTATSRTCALACRMNTALSVLSIRHHHLSPLQPLSHTLPFHATIHKQSFIILIPPSLYFFSVHNVRPRVYVSHYFDVLARAAHLGLIVEQLTFSLTSTWRESNIFLVAFLFVWGFFHTLSNWINIVHTKNSLDWEISSFSFNDGLCNVVFHCSRHAVHFTVVHWHRLLRLHILLLLLMLLSHMSQSGWLSCLSAGHVILLKAFMVLGLCYWNVT